MKATYHYFLGLQTLDVLAETTRLIYENTGKTVNLDEVPRDDEDTFVHIFQTGNTGKIFQFESAGMKKLLRDMKPTCLADLCAANAAYRPGPLQFIQEFIDGRNNPESVVYPTPEYEEIAKETKGILFYQEQIMLLVQKMAGFTLGQADILRRGIGKKEKKYIDEGRERFVKGCLDLGTADEKTAKYIYSTIEKFANYGFNKSHSDAYGLVAYLCGYLKQHYPAFFMAANCTINSNDVKKLAPCLNETRRMQIPILLPDVRCSSDRFVLEEYNGKYAIRFSLSAIRSIREESASAFVEASNKDSFDNFLQSLPNGSVNKRQLTYLINAGACDYLAPRLALTYALPEALEKAHFVNDMHAKGLPSIFSAIPTKITTVEYSSLEKLQLEKEAIQIALSGHPVTSIRNLSGIHYSITDVLENFDENSSEDSSIQLLGVIQNYRDFMTKKGDKMAVFTFDDEFSAIECVVFPKNFKHLADILRDYTDMLPVIISGRITMRDGAAQFIVSNISFIDKSTYTLYLAGNMDTSKEKQLEQILTKYNGIASVVLINIPNNKTNSYNCTVKTLSYKVDISKDLTDELRANNIPFIIKK